MLIVAVLVPMFVDEEPPFGEVTEHARVVSAQPVVAPSTMVYCLKSMMLLNTFVLFATVPSSLRGKFASGVGLAVNENDVAPSSGCASLTIVIEPGKMIASVEIWWSCPPPVPSRLSIETWYGEPGTFTAALP